MDATPFSTLSTMCDGLVTSMMRVVQPSIISTVAANLACQLDLIEVSDDVIFIRRTRR
jgi:hypothetical protein